MKKILLFSLTILAAFKAYAAPPVQSMGSTSISTSVAIRVTPTPIIILSTGINNPCIPGWIPGVSTTSIGGQYLCGRNYLEIRNDSQVSVWMGRTPQVSTIPNSANYGIQIPTGTSRIDTDNNPYWFIVSGLETSTSVVIVQKK